jgi:hypothetical protein
LGVGRWEACGRVRRVSTGRGGWRGGHAPRRRSAAPGRLKSALSLQVRDDEDDMADMARFVAALGSKKPALPLSAAGASAAARPAAPHAASKYIKKAAVAPAATLSQGREPQSLAPPPPFSSLPLQNFLPPPQQQQQRKPAASDETRPDATRKDVVPHPKSTSMPEFAQVAAPKRLDLQVRDTCINHQNTDHPPFFQHAVRLCCFDLAVFSCLAGPSS